MSIQQYGRYWTVYDSTGELVCLWGEKGGAVEGPLSLQEVSSVCAQQMGLTDFVLRVKTPPCGAGGVCCMHAKISYACENGLANLTLHLSLHVLTPVPDIVCRSGRGIIVLPRRFPTTHAGRACQRCYGSEDKAGTWYAPHAPWLWMPAKASALPCKRRQRYKEAMLSPGGGGSGDALP